MEALEKKILVIQTAFIGDAILTLPMIQELKRISPDHRIDVIAIPSTEEIFRNSPAVDEVIVLDKRGKDKSLFALNRFAKVIQRKNYSKIYSPHRSFRSTFIVLQSGVRDTYGFSNSSLPHSYKNLIEYCGDYHEVQRNLSLIGADVSGDKWKIVPVVKVPRDAEERVKTFLQANNLTDYVAIAPGSVWATKMYPADYFKEVISYFRSRNKKVVLIGSEKEKELCNLLSAENTINAAGIFSVIETIELLRHSSLLICNDSAPTHFAQCAEIPVLTLYCSTKPSIGFYPYNSRSAYLSYDDLFCKPCGIHGRTECPLKTFECGYNISPALVINRIKEIMND